MDDETPKRPRRGALAAAGLVAAGALGGAALGLTGGASAQAPTRSTAPEQNAPDGALHKGGRGRGHGGPMGHGIHGEFVVPKPGGGYQTVTTQVGAVTAVSATSIAVRSEDGYTATYVVTADTLVNAARDGIATIASGDTVHVAGIRSGGTLTAVRIVDRSKVEAGRQRFAPA